MVPESVILFFTPQQYISEDLQYINGGHKNITYTQESYEKNMVTNFARLHPALFFSLSLSVSQKIIFPQLMPLLRPTSTVPWAAVMHGDVFQADHAE